MVILVTVVIKAMTEILLQKCIRGMEAIPLAIIVIISFLLFLLFIFWEILLLFLLLILLLFLCGLERERAYLYLPFPYLGLVLRLDILPYLILITLSSTLLTKYVKTK